MGRKRMRPASLVQELAAATNGEDASDDVCDKAVCGDAGGTEVEGMMQAAVVPAVASSRAALQTCAAPLATQDMQLPPLLPPREPEALRVSALATLSTLDSATQEHCTRVIRTDDRLAELAARRGLLTRFVVKAVRTYAPSLELVVSAPEFASVDYLKRRIMRAKLGRGEWAPPRSIHLRRKLVDSSGAPPAVPHVTGMVNLSSRDASGEECFLLDAGFSAPGPHDVYLTVVQSLGGDDGSARAGQAASDATSTHMALPSPLQQSAMGLIDATAVRSAGDADSSMGIMTPEAGLLYHAMFPDPSQLSLVDGQALQRSLISGGFPLMTAVGQVHGAQQFLPDFSGTSSTAAVASAQALNVTAAQPAPDQQLEVKLPKPRRRTGRWNPEEIEALVQGVEQFGTSWAQIHERYFSRARMRCQRSHVDLKDKWRNLVRLVTDPSKQPRGSKMSDMMRRRILQLVFANDIPAADYVGATTSDVPADGVAPPSTSPTASEQDATGDAAASALATPPDAHHSRMPAPQQRHSTETGVNPLDLGAGGDLSHQLSAMLYGQTLDAAVLARIVADPTGMLFNGEAGGFDAATVQSTLMQVYGMDPVAAAAAATGAAEDATAFGVSPPTAAGVPQEGSTTPVSCAQRTASADKNQCGDESVCSARGAPACELTQGQV